MKTRATLTIACALLATGCFDFDGLIKRCGDGHCVEDGGGGSGGGGGGGASGGGGGDAGAPSSCLLKGAPTPLIANGGSTCTDAGPGFCFNGFYWENPLPQGNDLGAIWGFSPNDVWVGGDAAMLMHWDGTSWTSWQLTPSGADDGRVVNRLFGLDDLLFVGLSGDAALIVSGVSSYTASASVSNVSGWGGSTADGVWAVTEDRPANLWHFDCDGGWSRNALTPPDAAHADISGGDLAGGLFVASSEGTSNDVYRCTATTCSGVLLDASAEVTAIEPDGPGRVLIGALDGTLYEGFADGGVTRLDRAPLPAITGLSLDQGAGLMAGGGTNLTERKSDGGWGGALTVQGDLDSRVELTVPWAAPGLEGSWVVGQAGVMLWEHDGAFNVMSSGPPRTWETLVQTPLGLLVTGGDGVRLLRDAGSQAWDRYGDPLPFTALSSCSFPDGGVLLGGLLGSSAVVSSDGLLASGVTADGIDTSTTGVVGLACLPSGPVAMSGQHVLRPSADGGWNIVFTAPMTLTRADGFDDAHLAAVGGSSLFVFADGGWVEHASSAGGLFALWIDRSSGTIYVGGTSQNLSPPAAWAGSLAANQYGDADASVSKLTVNERSIPLSHDDAIYALASNGPTDIWAGGSDARLYHSDGGAFSAVEMGLRGHPPDYDRDINAMLLLPHGAGGNVLFVAGDHGFILRHPY